MLDSDPKLESKLVQDGHETASVAVMCLTAPRQLCGGYLDCSLRRQSDGDCNGGSAGVCFAWSIILRINDAMMHINKISFCPFHGIPYSLIIGSISFC